MSDTMLCGILRTPESHLDDPIVWMQFVIAARNAANELESRADEIARLHRAVVFAARTIDGIGDVDLHDEAYQAYVERTGDEDCQFGGPADEDYVEALILAAERSANDTAY